MRDDRYTIGQVARRTGLAVRTIRFYADQGIVAEAERSESGYRLYDAARLQRLELVRTLRELGFDLAAIRRLIAREASLAQLAATHAQLLDEQIRALALRRSVVRAIAHNSPDTERITLMNKLALMSDEGRQALIDDFVDHIFDGLEVDPEFAARIRSGRPALPDDPTTEQVEAWIELAELVQDGSFRSALRAMSQQQADHHASGAKMGSGDDWSSLAQQVLEHAGGARAAGVDPTSSEGWRVVNRLAPAFADIAGESDGPEFRASLAERISSGSDPRAERYWQLLGKVNGWPAIPSATPAWEWLAAALVAHARQSGN